MTRGILVFWLITAALLIWERRIARVIIYLAVFSSLSSLCFLLFAAPDIALAEVVVSVFATIIFITSFERYYSYMDQAFDDRKTEAVKIKKRFARNVFPVIFTAFLFALFVRFIPDASSGFPLKRQYLSMFARDVGGLNAVTAVYLGYRLYDTVFEALMLIVCMVAVIHLSEHKGVFGANSIYNSVRHSQISVVTIHAICPILLLFGVYLIVNGHLSPGGGYQGGVILASFFICRYMVYGISDTPIDKVLKVEKIFFALIVMLALFFIAFLAKASLPEHKAVYLIVMNLLIGVKVACGFFIMFFRFVSFESPQKE